MKKSAALAACALVSGMSFLPAVASASASICDSVVGNLIVNCGFEAGQTSSTLGGFTNAAAPPDWTLNTAFDEYNGFNQVVTNPVNSGTYALKIGDDDDQVAPTISQTITDSKGKTYSGTFYLSYGGSGDGAAFFDAEVNGTVAKSVTSLASFPFTKETFTFVGTGSDTLTFTGNTNPNEWYLDDISVVAAAVPEPASTWLMLFGAGAMGLAMLRRSKNAGPAALRSVRS
jgi:hypothetical protein